MMPEYGPPQSANIGTSAMSRPGESCVPSGLRARPSDELLRVEKLSSHKGDAGGVGEHRKPVAVEVGFVAEYVPFSDRLQKSLQNLLRRPTVLVEHHPRDPGQALRGGAPGVRVHRPPARRLDEVRIRHHRPILADDGPAEFCRKAGAAETRGFEVEKCDRPDHAAVVTRTGIRMSGSSLPRRLAV